MLIEMCERRISIRSNLNSHFLARPCHHCHKPLENPKTRSSGQDQRRSPSHATSFAAYFGAKFDKDADAAVFVLFWSRYNGPTRQRLSSPDFRSFQDPGDATPVQNLLERLGGTISMGLKGCYLVGQRLS